MFPGGGAGAGVVAAWPVQHPEGEATAPVAHAKEGALKTVVARSLRGALDCATIMPSSFFQSEDYRVEGFKGFSRLRSGGLAEDCRMFCLRSCYSLDGTQCLGYLYKLIDCMRINCNFYYMIV